MATSRSNALQLFVYISRTRARGTSAFLRESQKLPKLKRRENIPAAKNGNVFPLFCRVLCRVREKIIKSGRNIVLGWRKEGINRTK